WKTPADYIKSYFNKEIWLPPPQIYELSRLLNLSSLEEVKDFAQQRSKKVSVLPGDDLYPEDPNASDSQIKVDKEVKEFREGVEKLHRCANSFGDKIPLKTVIKNVLDSENPFEEFP
ncbi:hypothetical protein DOY81_012223, partial [Sarcophaga bullata]